eukprot:Hpha_TRINITY_DN16394_c1_g9::TRINITY_DN16394_c1_g9_i1::g.58929::m.58929
MWCLKNGYQRLDLCGSVPFCNMCPPRGVSIWGGGGGRDEAGPVTPVNPSLPSPASSRGAYTSRMSRWPVQKGGDSPDCFTVPRRDIHFFFCSPPIFFYAFSILPP